MRIVATGLLLLLLAPALADTIYRSVDEHGRPVFSDRPGPGSEPLQVGPLNVERPVQPLPRVEAESPAEEQFTRYRSLEITAPRDAVPNGLVPTDVEVRIDPALREGHRLELLLDGAFHAAAEEPAFTIEQMSRGPHTLQVRVVDAAGRKLQSSPEIEVYVHWPRVNRLRQGG